MRSRALLLIILGSLFVVAPRGRAADPSEVLILTSGERLEGMSSSFDANGNLNWQATDGSTRSVPLAEIDRLQLVPPPAPADATAEPDGPPVPPEADEPTTAPLVPPLPDAEEEVEEVEQSIVRESLSDWYEVVDGVYEGTLHYVARWTKRVELGARFIDGNANDNYIDIKGQFEQVSAAQMYKYELGGTHGKSDGEVAANRWYANATIDLGREGNWIIFMNSQNTFDELANTDYRGSLSGGLGYRFFNEAKKRFIVRVGPGVTYENFHDPSDERVTPDLFAETEIRWPFVCGSKLEHTTTMYPSVAAEDVFRLTSKSGLLFSLDNSDQWQLKLNFQYDYNSQPAANNEESDFLTSVLIVYTRK